MYASGVMPADPRTVTTGEAASCPLGTCGDPGRDEVVVPGVLLDPEPEPLDPEPDDAPGVVEPDDGAIAGHFGLATSDRSAAATFAVWAWSAELSGAYPRGSWPSLVPWSCPLPAA